MTHKFSPGTRVKYRTCPPPRLEFVLGGVAGLYMHLNAIPYVSAVVLRPLPAHWGGWEAIRPEGWPLPEDIFPYGFAAPIERLEAYDGPPLIAPITDGVGNPIPADEVKKRVDDYLRKKAIRNERIDHASL